MPVINDQMVSCFTNYLLARVENDDEPPFTPASWPVKVDSNGAGRFYADADGGVLEITVRPVGPAERLPWQTLQPAGQATP
jgi:hypothetical protein